jgi:hypothetical protein
MGRVENSRKKGREGTPRRSTKRMIGGERCCCTHPQHTLDPNPLCVCPCMPPSEAVDGN